MSEKQNEDNVTLGSIWKEIKSMRKEAKIQHWQAAIISGMGVAGAICFLGISTWVATALSPDWQWFDSLFFILLGVGLLAYFGRMERKLRKERIKAGENENTKATTS